MLGSIKIFQTYTFDQKNRFGYTSTKVFVCLFISAWSSFIFQYWNYHYNTNHNINIFIEYLTIYCNIVFLLCK